MISTNESMISASLVVVITVSIVIGGLTGMLLESMLNTVALAIAAGFFGVIAAGILRNLVVRRGMGLGPDSSSLPVVILVYSAVASLAGSLAATEIAETQLHLSTSMLGAISGLFSGLLMALLMITYHMNPDKPDNFIE